MPPAGSQDAGGRTFVESAEGFLKVWPTNGSTLSDEAMNGGMSLTGYLSWIEAINPILVRVGQTKPWRNALSVCLKRL